MKRWAAFGTLHPVMAVIVALLFSVLVGTSLHQARPQEKGEALATESEPELRPLLGVTSPTQNPLQIAILHWYNANLTTQFTVGTAPYGVAFDGQSIWICNKASTT